MTDQRTVKQHYVPECYLKHFTEKGLLTVYDVLENRFNRPIGTSGACYLCHYYEVEGLDYNEVERRLAKLENSLCKVIDGILKDPDLIRDHQKEVVRFASLLQVRSPVFRNAIRTSGLTDDSPDSNENSVETEVRSIHGSMIELVEHMFLDDRIREWMCVLKPFSNDILIASDNPVFPCDLREIAKVPLDTEISGAILPLDMRHLAIMFRKTDYERFGVQFLNSDDSVDPVKVNRLTMRGAIRYIYFKNRYMTPLIDESFDRYCFNDEVCDEIEDDKRDSDRYCREHVIRMD